MTAEDEAMTLMRQRPESRVVNYPRLPGFA
jgi:hypothetical protein